MDWITAFLDYTDGLPSPLHFREWAAISCVAGAMERRCWADAAYKQTFPNLYVILVGPPGTGKSIIDEISTLWRECKAFYVSPSSITKAALIDCLKDSQQTLLPDVGRPQLTQYNSLLVAAEEFGVLCPAHDLEFLSVLNVIYTNPTEYAERRRHGNGGKTLEIPFPQLNILAGTQPGFLAHTLPEEAWTMGFTSRLIMIYSATSPLLELFQERPQRREQEILLAAGLKAFSKLWGQFKWEKSAAEELNRWHMAKCPPIPDHAKLANYVARRTQHVIKLSMIAAVSRRHDLIIELEDVQRAKDWLIGAENKMPDIFRDMAQKSDDSVIQELHYYLWRKYMAEDRKPIHESYMYSFLKSRLPTEKVSRLIEVMERSAMIVKMPNSMLYNINPKRDI